jgi:hypothetical protein
MPIKRLYRFIERAQSSASSFAPRRKRASDKALTFVGTNPTGELITSGLPVIRPQSLARINRSKEATLKDEPERRVVPADRTGELSEWSISSRKCKTRRGRQSIFLCAFESRSRLSLNGALSRPAAIREFASCLANPALW